MKCNCMNCGEDYSTSDNHQNNHQYPECIRKFRIQAEIRDEDIMKKLISKATSDANDFFKFAHSFNLNLDSLPYAMTLNKYGNREYISDKLSCVVYRDITDDEIKCKLRILYIHEDKELKYETSVSQNDIST